MSISVEEGHVDAIRVLVKLLGGDVSIADNFGRTCIHFAAQEGHVEAIQMLVKHGGKVETPDIYGITPIHKAAQEGHVIAIRVLVELGQEESLISMHEEYPSRPCWGSWTIQIKERRAIIYI